MKPPNLTEQQEAALIAAAQKGDPDAFEQLIHLYEKRVFALTRRLCANPDDAQEAAQEAFIAAWKGLPFFRGESSFATWLYRLTNNACMDLLRKEQRHQAAAGPSLDDEEVELDVAAPAGDPHAEAEKSELRAAVEAGLRSLPKGFDKSKWGQDIVAAVKRGIARDLTKLPKLDKPRGNANGGAKNDDGVVDAEVVE